MWFLPGPGPTVFDASSLILIDCGILAPQPKCTDSNIDDELLEKCCKSDMVLVPAAVAFGSGQFDGERNSIGPSSALIGRFDALILKVTPSPAGVVLVLRVLVRLLAEKCRHTSNDLCAVERFVVCLQRHCMIAIYCNTIKGRA